MLRFLRPLLAAMPAVLLASCGGKTSLADGSEPGSSGGLATGGLANGGMASGGMGTGGGGSPGAGGSVASGGAPNAVDLLLDDFEDGDSTNALGSDWYTYDDRGNLGASTLTGQGGSASVVAAGGRDSMYGLSIQYQLTQADYAYDPFVGLGFALPSKVAVGYEGISYSYRGSSHTLRAETSNVADYDFYAIPIPASADWKTVSIPFTALTQAGFGASVPWSADLINELSWHIQAPDGTLGSLELDDIWLKKSIVVDRGPPDLAVPPASPPLKTELGDIAISSDLQKKAMAELNRGYNLTNWLESERFDGSFAFDHEYVAHLSKNGFLGVRLPIDLDLYVTGVSAEGDEIEVHPDLWTVLDTFDQWTREYGLSLTIDYHQYDHSFSFGDAAGVQQAILLWKAVAAHFADNVRGDLYYELLNEPELSTGASSALPASSWTPIAEEMIAAIRGQDTSHTIIFGDVNWYGIAELSQREPLSDDNIVYAFHSYEPFIFTHQGADWAQMATTHDIPFPYSAERWSEYSSDFGLTGAEPAWIWDQFRNYYRDGTVEAVWNRIAVAKAWAVKHGVPVICNEFGAYERRSRLEDRVAYYDAMIGTFEELEIPWQHWFMVMSEDGTIAPEYVEAFRLDR
jgi:endoglucanase